MAFGASVFAAGAAVVLAGGGVAAAGSAPDETGQKYSDASAAIDGAGFHAVVSTTTGDQKAWPDCVVARQVQRTLAPPPDSSGSPTNEVLVSLNCYSVEASATSSSYSAASPEGKVLKAAADAAKKKATG